MINERGSFPSCPNEKLFCYNLSLLALRISSRARESRPWDARSLGDAGLPYYDGTVRLFRSLQVTVHLHKSPQIIVNVHRSPSCYFARRLEQAGAAPPADALRAAVCRARLEIAHVCLDPVGGLGRAHHRRWLRAATRGVCKFVNFFFWERSNQQLTLAGDRMCSDQKLVWDSEMVGPALFDF
eukprot:6198238-Pleurochrysis_carterae.AAC.2